jgi:hypothetical protein
MKRANAAKMLKERLERFEKKHDELDKIKFNADGKLNLEVYMDMTRVYTDIMLTKKKMELNENTSHYLGKPQASIESMIESL